MRRVSQTHQFLRDVRRLRKRGKDLEKLRHVVKRLSEGRPLEKQFRDHLLSGIWQPSRNCHVESDWILIYTIDANELRLERTGSHSDLFAD